MKLILVRHGHVEGIDPPHFRGRREVALTALGRRQAEATAARIAAEWQADALYSSPFDRCRATADAIGARQGLTAQVLPDLLDFDYGEWSGRSLDEVRASDPAAFDLWFSAPHLAAVPGGDSLQALMLRAADALRLMRAAHPDGIVIAVAHDSVNRALLVQLLDMPLSRYWTLRQDPCCVNEIDIGNTITIHRINEHGHLPGLTGASGIA